MPVNFTQRYLDGILRQSPRPKSEVTDAQTKGLALRANPASVSWWLRTEIGGVSRRVHVGDPPLTTIADARRIVSEAMDMLRRQAGEPDAAWIARKRIELGIDRPDEEVLPTKSKDRWTYSEARAHYLVEVRRVGRDKYADTQRQFLSHPELRHLDEREVGSIRRQEVAEILLRIHRSGRETQAINMANAVRPMWTYLEGDAIVAHTNVREGEMVRLRAPRRSRVKKADAKRHERTPELAQCGRLLAISRAGVLEPSIARAIQIMVLTVQRRFSVVQAKVSHVVDEGDFYVWTLPLEDLKTGEKRVGSAGEEIMEHELPLPRESAEAMREAVVDAEGEWLFPQIRPKRKGDPVSHVSESTLTHTLQECPGIFFSPHDLRRTFTTEIERTLEFPENAPARILDHAEGRKHKNTTARHYNRYRTLKQKLAMLQIWSDLIEPIAEELKETIDWREFDRQLCSNRVDRRAKRPMRFP